MKWFAALLAASIVLFYPVHAFARQTGTEPKTVEQALEEQLSQTDLSAMEDAVRELSAMQDESAIALLFPNGVAAAVRDSVGGGKSLARGLYESAKESLTWTIRRTSSFFALLCGAALLSAFCAQSMGGVRDEGIVSAVGFACTAFCAVPILTRLTQSVSLASTTLERLCTWMEAVTPVMLAVLSSIGASASVGVLRPAAIAVNAVVQHASVHVVFPMILVMGTFAVVDALSPTRRFEALVRFLSQTIKWSLGAALTIFAGVMTLRSVNAVSYDALSIRTMKFTIGSVPVVGGAVSDSMDAIISCVLLIKNGVGTTGVAAAAALCLGPVLKIVADLLCLRLCGALMQPLGAQNMTVLTDAAAEVFKTLVCVMIAVLLMFFLTGMLTLAAGNAAFAG